MMAALVSGASSITIMLPSRATRPFTTMAPRGPPAVKATRDGLAVAGCSVRLDKVELAQSGEPPGNETRARAVMTDDRHPAGNGPNPLCYCICARSAAAAANGARTTAVSEIAARIEIEPQKLPGGVSTADIADMPKMSVGM